MTTTLRIESVQPEPQPSPQPPPRRRSNAVLAFLMVCSFLAGCLVTYFLMKEDDKFEIAVLQRIDEYLWLASGHQEPRYGSLGFPQTAEEATLISQLRKRGDFYQRVSGGNSRVDGPILRRGINSRTFSVYSFAYTAGLESKGQWLYQPKTDLLPQDTKASERVIEPELYHFLTVLGVGVL